MKTFFTELYISNQLGFGINLNCLVIDSESKARLGTRVSDARGKTYKMRVFLLLNNRYVVQFDVQILVDAFERSPNGDVVL